MIRSFRSRLKISEVGLPIGPSARGIGGRDKSWVTSARLAALAWVS
jgi:hypothetical protein